MAYNEEKFEVKEINVNTTVIPMNNEQEILDYKLLFEEIINTANSYNRIFSTVAGKDPILDSILVTAMAANAGLHTYIMGKQNIMYEKAVALHDKLIHAKATGTVFTESESRELSVLTEELKKTLNKAMKRR